MVAKTSSPGSVAGWLAGSLVLALGGAEEVMG